MDIREVEAREVSAKEMHDLIIRNGGREILPGFYEINFQPIDITEEQE